MIVVVLMTPIVTVMDSVTWFGPRKGMGRGVCTIFLRTACLTRDLMEDSGVSSNLSVPKVREPDQAATSARAKKSPKPREHVQLLLKVLSGSLHCVVL